MPHIKETAKVVSQVCLEKDIYSMVIKTEKIAEMAVPGQFISVYTKDGSKLLPRPISICEVDGDTLRIVYRVVGAGTLEFSKYTEGTKVDIMGPLGNGFTLKEKNAVLIAGGIGIPPMVELAKRLKATYPAIKITSVVGYRDKNTFLVEDLEKYSEVVIATDDGSLGVHGNVITAMNEVKTDGEVIYSCGPTPMLRGVKAYAMEHDIEAQISLEEKMACGIGACLACVCKTKEIDDHSHVHNARVCKDGPVFDAREVEI